MRRVNRFAAEVQVGSEVWPVHLPNSGRMTELLVPGAAVRVALSGKTHGPDVDQMMAILGRDRVAARLDRALERAGRGA
ncbi:MAG: hypothetical protein K6T29_10370 [Peptococcaceae bacterium]|nr:hypothetical protein [Peptococcaceae bacterium]